MYHDWAHYKAIVLPPKEGLFLDISSPGERRLRFASEAGRAQWEGISPTTYGMGKYFTLW